MIGVCLYSLRVLVFVLKTIENFSRWFGDGFQPGFIRLLPPTFPPALSTCCDFVVNLPRLCLFPTFPLVKCLTISS